MVSDFLRVRFGREPVKSLATILTVTTRCDLRCQYCYIGQLTSSFPEGYASRDLDFDSLRVVIKKIKAATREIIFTGGEPFMREDFGQIVDYALSLKFQYVASFTNGTRLMENLDIIKKLDTLFISLDAARLKQYPGLADKIFPGVEYIKENLKTKVIFNFTLQDVDTFPEIKKLLDFIAARKLCVWIHLLRNQGAAQDFDRFNGMMRQIRDYLPPALLFNKIGRPYDPSTKWVCVPKLNYFVDHKGNLLYPCGFDKGRPVGNLLESDLAQLWASAKRKHGVYPNEDCRDCLYNCYWEVAFILKHPVKGRSVLLNHQK